MPAHRPQTSGKEQIPAATVADLFETLIANHGPEAVLTAAFTAIDRTTPFFASPNAEQRFAVLSAPFLHKGKSTPSVTPDKVNGDAKEAHGEKEATDGEPSKRPASGGNGQFTVTAGAAAGSNPAAAAFASVGVKANVAVSSDGAASAHQMLSSPGSHHPQSHAGSAASTPLQSAAAVPSAGSPAAGSAQPHHRTPPSVLPTLNAGADSSATSHHADPTASGGRPLGLGNRPGARPPQSSNLMVVGLPPEVDDAWFRELLEPFGTIVSCVVMLNSTTGRSRGFGFVHYDSESDAANAKAALTGRQIGQSKLLVKYSAHSGRIARCTTIYVRNLPLSLTDQEANACFSQFGQVLSMQCFNDGYNQDELMSAFIEYPQPQNAAAAVDGLRGKLIRPSDTSPLFVKFANKEPRDGPPRARGMEYGMQQMDSMSANGMAMGTGMGGVHPDMQAVYAMQQGMAGSHPGSFDEFASGMPGGAGTDSFAAAAAHQTMMQQMMAGVASGGGVADGYHMMPGGGMGGAGMASPFTPPQNPVQATAFTAPGYDPARSSTSAPHGAGSMSSPDATLDDSRSHNGHSNNGHSAIAGAGGDAGDNRLLAAAAALSDPRMVEISTSILDQLDDDDAASGGHASKKQHGSVTSWADVSRTGNIGATPKSVVDPPPQVPLFFDLAGSSTGSPGTGAWAKPPGPHRSPQSSLPSAAVSPAGMEVQTDAVAHVGLDFLSSLGAKAQGA